MFNVFRSSYDRDTNTVGGQVVPDSVPDMSGLHELFSEFGGASFGQGRYRVVMPVDYPQWLERLALGFPAFGHAVPFGFDWLGRLFALDERRLEDGEPGVILVEPGTAEVLEVPANIFSFHEVELVEHQEAALAKGFFETWLAEGNAALGPEECAGYKIPLFLGGADDTSNLQRSEIDVYWHVMSQLIQRVAGRS